ncbi:hypothetical protein NDU88_004546 [Pleurodeles waltl]|uniref:Uncharacterized protein n=1 Tax=Pleurodeles waltl TaxID=8319 RepID=A0AAV7TUL0_PLEWA|nr:hypothetical protein NDU88_004546 [Pleurodeles waltl]
MCGTPRQGGTARNSMLPEIPKLQALMIPLVMPVDWSSSSQSHVAQPGRSTSSVREPQYHPQLPSQRSPGAQLNVRSTEYNAGRGVPVQPRSAEQRRAWRLGRPGTAEAALVRTTGRPHSRLSGASPRAGITLFSGSPRTPEGPSRKAPSAKGPGEEPARGPKKPTHQPWPLAPTLQAASSSSALDGTPASLKGSLPLPVVLSSRVDGAHLIEGGGRRFQDVNVGQARSCSIILPLR